MGLVLAPTRELANQIFEAALPFARKIGVYIRVVYGGADVIPQKKKLKEGVDILIATPGRLIDLVESQSVFLDKVVYYVLDEADRMLDMGFLPQVKRIITELPDERQTLLWSATWPKEVESLAAEVCKHTPVTIKVGDDSLTVNNAISQKIICLEEHQKFDEMCNIMSEIHQNNIKDKVLIFARTKRGCDKLAESLDRAGFKAVAIHGDKSQQKRDSIIYQFKKGYKTMLVATDVASRGLDIKDIGHVINFDFPMTIEDYIHRIGRTGRAGATGCSYTFFSSADLCFVGDLIRVLKKSGQEVEQRLYDFLNEYRNKKSNGYSKFNRFAKNRYNSDFGGKGGFNNNNGFKFSNNRGQEGNSYGNNAMSNGNKGGFFQNNNYGNRQQNGGEQSNDFSLTSKGAMFNKTGGNYNPSQSSGGFGGPKMQQQNFQKNNFYDRNQNQGANGNFNGGYNKSFPQGQNYGGEKKNPGLFGQMEAGNVTNNAPMGDQNQRPNKPYYNKNTEQKGNFDPSQQRPRYNNNQEFQGQKPTGKGFEERFAFRENDGARKFTNSKTVQGDTLLKGNQENMSYAQNGGQPNWKNQQKPYNNNGQNFNNGGDQQYRKNNYNNAPRNHNDYNNTGNKQEYAGNFAGNVDKNTNNMGDQPNRQPKFQQNYEMI